MLLIDELVSHDAHGATCKVTLKENAAFARDGRVPAIVGLEYLAQCVAAFATLHPEPGRDAAPNVAPSKPRIGYLVGVRGLDLAVESFDVGDELLVTVNHVWGSGEGAQFTGAIEREGQTVVKGTLTVYVPPSVEASEATR